MSKWKSEEKKLQEMIVKFGADSSEVKEQQKIVDELKSDLDKYLGLAMQKS